MDKVGYFSFNSSLIFCFAAKKTKNTSYIRLIINVILESQLNNQAIDNQSNIIFNELMSLQVFIYKLK